jgi:hypothetical protein
MSTNRGAESPPSHPERESRAHIPWIPVVAALGIAAFAWLLVRKIQSSDEGLTLESALDQCDRAAGMLDQRVRTTNGALVN